MFFDYISNGLIVESLEDTEKLKEKRITHSTNYRQQLLNT